MLTQNRKRKQQSQVTIYLLQKEIWAVFINTKSDFAVLTLIYDLNQSVVWKWSLHMIRMGKVPDSFVPVFTGTDYSGSNVTHREIQTPSYPVTPTGLGPVYHRHGRFRGRSVCLQIHAFHSAVHTNTHTPTPQLRKPGGRGVNIAIVCMP